MTISLEDLVSDVRQLVTLPEVFHRVEEALQDPSKSLEDVGEIIQTDVDLSSRLLGLANSALFRRGLPIDTVGRALTAIGTRDLRDIVLATLVVRLFSRLPFGSVNMLGFWRHSLACAVTARTLMVARRAPDADRLYVAGLLHDIGRLLMYLRMPEAMHEALVNRDAGDLLLHLVEQEMFGFDHAAAGAALLRSWSVPECICLPVSWHHQPEKARRFPLESAALHAADVITSCLEYGSTGEQIVPPLNAEAWALLEIPESALAEISARVEAQVEELSGLMLH